jgi:CheY-like chemotaxis protein
MPLAEMHANTDPDTVHAATVLVVEDEDLVRMPIAEYLRDCGYNVLEAGDAREAIGLADEDHVDVVFSDVRMPGEMDGFGLARWFRMHHPEVPVLLTSGYNTSWASEAEPVRLIGKPYSQRQVLERIRAALRG